MESSAPRTDPGWPHAATLVLAAESPRQRRWAVNTAIQVVRRMAVQHPKVVLADLQTRTPSALAAALGVESGPGISDVLFRNAAFSKVASRPEGEAFFFLTVGEAPPPLQVLYQHPRWTKIAARLEATDAHLLPCVSASDLLEAGPIPGFEACIVLNAAGLEVELPSQARRLAEFLAPPEIRDEEDESVELPWYVSAESETQPEPGSTAAVGHPRAETAEAEEPAGTPRMPPLSAPAFTDEPTLPRPAAEPIIRRSRPRRLLPVALAAAAALVLLVLWQMVGVRQIPEGSVGVEPVAETALAEETSVPAGQASSPAPPLREVGLPYSVAIAAYSSLDDAETRQREWGRSDVPFYVAPTVVRGVVYYRVFAGMLPEREEAEELMAQLVHDGIKDTIRSWDVRRVQLAFNFGTYASLDEARAVLETLSGHRVPAYVVPAVAEAGGDVTAYRIYAGGYERPEDARPLRERIEGAGFDVELVERVGLLLR